MIYIKEIFPDDKSVAVYVDGILDDKSIHILKSVCERHLDGNRKVILHLQELIHITREGKDFLREIGNKISIIDSQSFGIE
jgi:hypothetical protein